MIRWKCLFGIHEWTFWCSPIVEINYDLTTKQVGTSYAFNCIYCKKRKFKSKYS